MIPVVIIRHYKERLSKCSLRPLENRENFEFLKYKPEFSYSADNHTVLGMSGPVISESDAERPLLLLDSTWRLLPKMETCLEGEYVRRSLPPGIKTAYPRVSKIDEDPDGGLASIEALYLCLKLMGHDDPSILSEYRWKDEFLGSLTI